MGPRIINTILSSVFFLIAIASTSCKKDEICDHPSLPCQTHEGKNTFGCLIDGVPFVAKTSFSIGGAVPVSGQFNENENFFQIQGTREDALENLDKISFKSFISNGLGIYTMDVNTDHYNGYMDYSGQTCEYFHDLNNKGTVEIKYLDREKNIISGIFFMTLINPDCSKETLTISQGRFDFGY